MPSPPPAGSQSNPWGELIGGLAGLLTRGGKSEADRNARRQRRDRLASEAYWLKKTYGVDSREWRDFRKRHPDIAKRVNAGEFSYLTGDTGMAKPGSPGLKPFVFRPGDAAFRRAAAPIIGGAIRRIDTGRLTISPGALLGAALFGAQVAGAVRRAIGPGHLGELGPPLQVPGRPDPLAPPRAITPAAPRVRVAMPDPVTARVQTQLHGKASGSQPALGSVAPGLAPVQVTARKLPVMTLPKIDLSPKRFERPKPFVPITKDAKPAWLEFLVQPLWEHLQPALLSIATDRERKPRARPTPTETPVPDPPPAGNPGSMPFPQASLTGYRSAGVRSCECGPKKPRKPRKPRTECHSGRYIERSDGTQKTKLRSVPCRPSRKKRPSRRAQLSTTSRRAARSST